MASEIAIEGMAQRARKRRPIQRIFKGLKYFAKHKPLGFVGLVVVLFFLATAFLDLAQLWTHVTITPYHYSEIDRTSSFDGPTLKHLMGTDNIGRDVFSRIVWGALVSIIIGFSAVAFSSVISSSLGLVSGFVGGWFDTILQRIVDIWMTLPGLIMLIIIMGVFAAQVQNQWLRILIMTFAIGLMAAGHGVRTIRGMVLSLKNSVYIEAARAVGAGMPRIIILYVAPGVMALIILGATVGLGGAILAEAGLSFLGFGLPKVGIPTWGQMLEDARNSYSSAPWLAIYPGLAIAITVFGFNVFGDAIRDVLDPRLRGR